MAVTISGTGGLTFPDNSVQASSGTTTTGALRAWVNFNGTGTVAIRASGNVSSITDNGTGLYRVNFSTAMPDANYAVASTGGRNASGTDLSFTGTYGTQATTSVNIHTTNGAPTLTDLAYVFATIHR